MLPSRFEAYIIPESTTGSAQNHPFESLKIQFQEPFNESTA